MIALYHWEPNGVFLKPLMALAEKGAAYTSHWFDPTAFRPTQKARYNSSAKARCWSSAARYLAVPRSSWSTSTKPWPGPTCSP